MVDSSSPSKPQISMMLSKEDQRRPQIFGTWNEDF